MEGFATKIISGVLAPKADQMCLLFFVKSVFKHNFQLEHIKCKLLCSQTKHSYSIFLQSNKHSQGYTIQLRNQQESYFTLPSSLNSSTSVIFFIFLRLSSFEQVAVDVMVLTSGTSSLNLIAGSSFLSKQK